MATAVAVQRLNARHRDDITRHLLALGAEDRRLRFGRPIQDEAVRAYAAGLDFERDRVFGILSPALDVIGCAHLALDRSARAAELGLSVDPAARTRGHGFALLTRAVLHAANRGFHTLYMYCLAENRIMLHLAQKAGLTVVISGGEAESRLKLARASYGSAMQEVVADQLALVDCLFKQQSLWLGAGAGATPRSTSPQGQAASAPAAAPSPAS